MTQGPFVIKKSKKKQVSLVLGGGALIGYYFIGPYEKTRVIYKKNPTFTILLGVIFIALFLYFLNDLIKRKAEITLTSEGIELRNTGFFDWAMIQSFKIVYYPYCDSHEEELVLHFKEFDDVKFDISLLEKNRDELVELILTYQGSSGIFYVGHEAK